MSGVIWGYALGEMCLLGFGGLLGRLLGRRLLREDRMFSEVLFPLFFLYRGISFVTLIRLTSAYRIDKQPGFIS
jgi:hypothetical protein